MKVSIVEKWFQLMCHESHQPIWGLIPDLHKAEISAKKKKIDIILGWQDESKRNKKYQTISHKLKRIVDFYNPEDPHETFKNCQHYKSKDNTRYY